MVNISQVDNIISGRFRVGESTKIYESIMLMTEKLSSKSENQTSRDVRRWHVSVHLPCVSSRPVSARDATSKKGDERGVDVKMSGRCYQVSIPLYVFRLRSVG
ncbi:hypothetical protein CEXT_523761 [Caerostris extrusa]|uniref:Uncharacterized protein n=1 Tax=Caerostris extrusa TaxID=172846 RepID=A0AAV4T667_CAEEX|nr:hypothetical protein CEXT_523761 [Caerostris extrusa]